MHNNKHIIIIHVVGRITGSDGQVNLKLNTKQFLFNIYFKKSKQKEHLSITKRKNQLHHCY